MNLIQLAHVTFLMLLWLTPFAETIRANPVGKLLQVNGQVEVLRAGAIMRPENGFELEIDDQVTVSSGTDAVIVLRDKSMLYLKSGSSLKIVESMLRSSEKGTISSQVIQVLNGYIAASVVKQNKDDEFKFRVRGMALGIRGTKLTVLAEENPVVIVTEGEVAVASSDNLKDAALVSQGEKAQLDEKDSTIWSSKVSKKMLQSLDSAFSVIKTVGISAAVEASEFAQRATLAAVNLLKLMGTATVSTVETEVHNIVERDKLIFATLQFQTQPRSLTQMAGSFGGAGIGLRLLEPRRQEKWFFDRVVEASYLKAEYTADDVSGEVNAIDGAFALHWGKEIRWLRAEPSFSLAAKVRNWVGKTDYEGRGESFLKSGHAYGPAIGVGFLLPITPYITMQFETAVTYWFGEASGTDIMVKAGSGLCF